MTAVRRVVSPLVVVALFGLGALGLSVLTAGSIEAVRVASPTFDDLTVAGASALAWLLFGYLALGAVLTFLGTVPGVVGSACGALAEAVTPRAYRRVAQVALGLTVIAGPSLCSVTANATPHDAPNPITSTGLQSLDRPGLTSEAPRLLDLDRPGNTAKEGSRLDLDRPGNTSAAPRATDRDPLIRPVRDVDQDHYTVRRGDCLWHIAERHLGPGATSTEITTEWHRWYEANRDLIGDNPDLILVGQVFRIP
jgi:nucleoid-associated protein YgaU